MCCLSQVYFDITAADKITQFFTIKYADALTVNMVSLTIALEGDSLYQVLKLGGWLVLDFAALCRAVGLESWTWTQVGLESDL